MFDFNAVLNDTTIANKAPVIPLNSMCPAIKEWVHMNAINKNLIENHFLYDLIKTQKIKITYKIDEIKPYMKNKSQKSDSRVSYLPSRDLRLLKET